MSIATPVRAQNLYFVISSGQSDGTARPFHKGGRTLDRVGGSKLRQNVSTKHRDIVASPPKRLYYLAPQSDRSYHEMPSCILEYIALRYTRWEMNASSVRFLESESVASNNHSCVQLRILQANVLRTCCNSFQLVKAGGFAWRYLQANKTEDVNYSWQLWRLNCPHSPPS